MQPKLSVRTTTTRSVKSWIFNDEWIIKIGGVNYRHYTLMAADAEKVGMHVFADSGAVYGPEDEFYALELQISSDRKAEGFDEYNRPLFKFVNNGKFVKLPVEVFKRR